MWYVIWTSTGSESRTAEEIKKYTDRCFVPGKVISIKRGGNWERAQKTLFPGYLFVDCKDADKLAENIRKIEGFNRILTIDKKIFPLYGNDANFVEKLYNIGGIFDTSEGYIEGDLIKVIAGPLYGLEGLIKKIDRHKRLAYLEFTMFGQTINTSVGLEITEKK